MAPVRVVACLRVVGDGGAGDLCRVREGAGAAYEVEEGAEEGEEGEGAEDDAGDCAF